MPPSEKPAEINQLTQIADQLHSQSIHLLRRLRKEDDKSGLSPARLSALSVIVHLGPLSLSVLAAAEQVRAPTMTKLVQALEHDGLVTRSRGQDKRVSLLAATPEGEAVLEAGKQRRIAVLTSQLNHLNPSELAAVEQSLALLAPLIKNM